MIINTLFCLFGCRYRPGEPGMGRDITQAPARLLADPGKKI